MVAREVREVLERTNFADELTRALTAVSFEIRTSVRFVPNDAGDRATPEVRSQGEREEEHASSGARRTNPRARKRR